MHPQLPRPVERFAQEEPQVWEAFNRLGDACHEAAAVLDERTRRLAKVALAVGAGLEGGTHSAVRNAIAAGVAPAEIRAVSVLAITTLGFPASVRARTWIDDAIAQHAP